jgi:hypothetical protein
LLLRCGEERTWRGCPASALNSRDISAQLFWW